MHPFFQGMDVMKIPYFTNIILDISHPIVLVRAATETECENGPVQSPLPRLFSFAESSKSRMVHDKNQLFYRMIKVRYSMVRKNILHLVQEEANKQIKGAKMNLDSKYHDGAVWVDQGEIAGCADGTFDNICAAADILRGKSCGNGAFTLSIYPGSMPALAELIRNGRASDRFSKPQSTCSLLQAGCGFCHFLAESNCRAVIGVVYY